MGAHFTSLSHTLDYSLTLQYPSDVQEAAAELDARLWRALEQLAGQPRIPRGEEGLGFECVVAQETGVPGLVGRTYQYLMAAQPVKLGGCGLRSLDETRFPAFVGGVEMALPYLVPGEHGEGVICVQLREVIGDMTGPQRWAQFLAAGSRTAREFEAAWNALTTEAQQVWDYLDDEPTGPLAVVAAEAGGTSINGSTRSMVVKGREEMRHRLLIRALANYPDRDARPVTVFPNVADDKCAGRWLLATPSQDLGMSRAVFQQALSAHLCLPSPAVRDGGWVGRTVPGGEVIDRYGDAIMCSKEIPGDSWRKRHDLVAEAALSKVPIDCEVYGLFSHLWRWRGASSSGAGLARGRSPTSRSCSPPRRDPYPASQSSRPSVWARHGSPGVWTARGQTDMPHASPWSTRGYYVATT